MKKFLQQRSLLLHPFLWAAYFPLALLGGNIEQLHPGLAVRSLLSALLVAGLLLLAARLFFRDWHRAAASTSLFMIAFFTYGHVYSLVEDRQLFGILLGRHRFLAAVYILVLAVLWIALWRQKNPQRTTQALNWIGLFMVALPVYQVAAFRIDNYLTLKGLDTGELADPVAGLQVPAGETPPDIYYIILDTYTRADVLEEQFDYDNRAFLEALAERGFYTANCSQSNYAATALSLTSSLNMRYLQDLGPGFASGEADERDLYPFLWDKRVSRALRELGYQFVAFDSGYSPTEFRWADSYLSQDTDLLGIILMDGINPFEYILLSTSAAQIMYELSPNLSESLQRFLALETSYIIHRNRILYTLNRLERLGGTPGPKFVFVHILSPHNPFVFGPNGEHLERKTPFTLNDDRDAILMEDYIQGFSDQVTYLNGRMLEIVDAILADSERPPVILIQGDHGVPRFSEQRNTILNTYYLPDVGSRLYPYISPVNTFRVLFDAYFSGDLGTLPDEACGYDRTAPFDCQIVPDPNPACLNLETTPP